MFFRNLSFIIIVNGFAYQHDKNTSKYGTLSAILIYYREGRQTIFGDCTLPYSRKFVNRQYFTKPNNVF